jgi:site-specific DNA-cytosine methylase
MQDKYVCEDYDITNYNITQFLTLKYGEGWRKVLLDSKEHIGSYDYLLEKDLMLEFKEYVETREEVDQKCLRDVIHIIKKVSIGKRFRITHKVLLLDKYYVCAVIGELMERNVHPTENRRMNIREYMHLMGMPHNFQIYDKKDYTKLTQNTPVTTCEDIIKECVAVIEDKRKFSTEKFVMQNNIKQVTETIKSKSTCLF